MRIIHAADFHLDSPFDGLSPEQAVQRRAEQRQLLERLSELARSTRAEAVLLAGDLLDGDRVYYETVEALSRTLGQIDAPVFIAPGNHDYYTSRSPYAVNPWPENVHIFRSGQIEAVELPGGNAVVYGAAFTADGRGESLLRGFSAPQDGKLHLMVLHADVDARQGSRYCPVSSADIAASGLDYLALGHIHTCTGVQRAGNVPWAYSGCPEGRGFDETGEKGALLVTLDSSGAEAEFVPLAMRRYEILTADMTGDDPAAALMAVLPQERERDIFRILLKGSAGALDLEALTALAAPYFYSVTLRDETRPARNLWERLEEDTLTGLFLRQLRARMEESSDPGERERLELAARFGLAALENGEDCRP